MRLLPASLPIAALLAAASGASGQVTIAALNTAYTQNFDGLASTGSSNTWTNNTTVPGWYSSQSVYVAGTGSGTTGGLYSFGSSAADRSLGGLASNGTGNITFSVGLLNSTGVAVTGLTVSYAGEQWRNGGNTTAQSLTLEWGIGSTLAGVSTWTAAGSSFTFTGPIATASSAAVDGNVAGRVANLGGTIAATVAAGETVWLRWTDLNDSGNDHGLSIDNVSITAIPEPAHIAFGFGALALAGTVLARRRKF